MDTDAPLDDEVMKIVDLSDLNPKDYPHVDPKLLDFRNFLSDVWRHLNLPFPTPAQYQMARYMQCGDERAILEAFRGIGKSYIACAFVCWILLLLPDFKIMVVSANKARADDFSNFVQRLILEMPILVHMIPTKGQSWSKIAFTVEDAQASGSPSVKSVGITGQLTGSRANLIIADDIEIPANSMTVLMRERLGESVKEFDAVLSPGGRILYLGTPQCEMSLYNVLLNRGYKMRIWPARYPTIEHATKTYGDRLAPEVWALIRELGEECFGQPTDPKRFTEEELIKRELSYGRSGFALQFMLDTSLADADRYPLKLSDLIIMSCDRDKAPEKPLYGIMKQLKDLPNVGLNGDKYYAPEALVGGFLDYSGSVLVVDPSGRGADETSVCIVKMLNGYLYVPLCEGITGGYEAPVLQHIADLAKTHKVNMILVESNFGDGMFSSLLAPYMKRTYPCTMEEVRHNIQKEKRIIDTLEPVMNQHRLVIDPKVIEKDYESVQDRPIEKAQQFMLAYQMTRITNLKGALAHDDRLDALAMGVKYWTDQMSADADEQMDAHETAMLEAELDKFLEAANTMSPRGKGTWI